MLIAQIAHNAVTAKLVNATKELKLQVQQLLSYKVEGAEHAMTFKAGRWDGRSSFFNFEKGTFPRGFVVLVQQALQKEGYRVQIVKKPYPAPLGAERPEIDRFGYVDRYDYQPAVMDQLVRNGQIIARVATGGGKSRIARMCYARIGRTTLFLTTRGALLYQMADAFVEMGVKTAVLGDGKIEISSQVTCGMVQTIMSWLKETSVEAEMGAILASLKRRKVEPKDWPSDEEITAKAQAAVAKQQAKRQTMIKALERFEFVILEEAHEASGNSYFEILRHCINAHYRLALTATPFMKSDEEANMRLMASSGPVAIHVSEELLINRGILARPYFKFVKIAQRPPKLYRSTPWQRAYELGVVENELRNRYIVAESVRASRYGLPVMVLVQRKQHGEALTESMTRNGLKVVFIQGEDDQAGRKRALNALGSGEINVLIGTNILDVGVDVPAVGMVILAAGGKAEVSLRQRIGRGLREKKNGMPNVAFIIDFEDEHNSTLHEHARARQAVIGATPGFAENVVRDFDFAGLGLEKKTT